MKWIKQKSTDFTVPTYRCSRCGSIWMTVKIKAKPPKRCKACGEKEEKTVKPTVCANCGYEMYFTDGTCHYCGRRLGEKATPSVVADAAPPSSDREAYGWSRTPAPTAVPEGGGDDG